MYLTILQYADKNAIILRFILIFLIFLIITQLPTPTPK
ncbi:MAG: hypothetical protein CLLPBCKN_008175 [Chroococcidiopsis cubana SAG 39.79]|nr:hypothetical protein [Chroococcidiopsis cubana SAG 39.79]